MKINFISKSFLLFGNFTNIVTEDFEKITSKFSQPDFIISQFFEQNTNAFPQNRGISINSNKNKITINLLPNKIEFISSSSSSYDKISHFIHMIVDDHCHPFNRIAIHQSIALQDSTAKIRKSMLSNSLKKDFSDKTIEEYSLRFNDVKHIESEEINAISIINSGYIQNFISKNGSIYPIMKDALFINTDINSSQKNLVDRFTSKNIDSWLLSIESINEETLKGLIDVCVSEQM